MPKNRRKGQRKGARWSRASGRDRGRRLSDKPNTDYTYNPNDAGEPMLSWAQAQQTVKLITRGQSIERFTIANELPLKIQAPNHGSPREKAVKSPKKTILSVPMTGPSFQAVENHQKTVEQVIAPPDAQQESYVCDEEDHEMLKMVKPLYGTITTEAFEDSITLLERESIKCRGQNQSFTLPVDEDAVCSVCQKGDCDNTNMILFCDMCNLAVHQECYGVPYIPEGQWHCRRCMVSPSRPAQCVLCPNSEGALKQTEDGHWAHVICAMYTPRVMFKSTQLLEPVMNIEKIEKSRWKLKCVVCKSQPNYSKETQVGVCIQCEEPACKTAFHVTCAQKAGYYMELKPVDDDGDAGEQGNQSGVKAIAYCDKHSSSQPRKRDPKHASLTGRSNNANKAQQQQNRMDSLNIDAEKLLQIATQVKLNNKPKLFSLILCYWKSKRRYRNGLPLLKRPKGRNTVAQRAANHEELERLRALIQVTLQRTEKLRTLTEYKLRKDKTDFRRDKLLDVRQGFEIMPAKSVLDHFFSKIRALDKETNYFAHPVTEKIAPKYFSIISHPMDFSTMSKKFDEGRYRTFEEFEADIGLILKNCLTYNTADTVFHQFTLQIQPSVNAMLEDARRDFKEFVDKPQRTSSSWFNLTRGASVARSPEKPTQPINSPDTNGVEDDLLSEISAAEEPETSDQVTRVSDSKPAVVTVTPMITHVPGPVVACPSPSNSRAIPSSPKARKLSALLERASVDFDDSNDVDSGPARKRIRTTPAETEEVHASSSRVPTPMDPTIPPIQPAMHTAYRNGRLNAFASESEPDPPFASEDSTDQPSSDCDVDSDGPASRLRRRLSSANHAGTYIEIRPRDFVWAKTPGHAFFPALVVDPRASKGYMVGGFQVHAPPMEILNSKKALEKKQTGPLYLVNFFDAKRNWAWVQREQLDVFIIDEKVVQARLNASHKAGEKRKLKTAFDLALKHMNGGVSVVAADAAHGASPMDVGESDVDED